MDIVSDIESGICSSLVLSRIYDFISRRLNPMQGTPTLLEAIHLTKTKIWGLYTLHHLILCLFLSYTTLWIFLLRIHNRILDFSVGTYWVTYYIWFQICKDDFHIVLICYMFKKFKYSQLKNNNNLFIYLIVPLRKEEIKVACSWLTIEYLCA